VIILSDTEGALPAAKLRFTNTDITAEKVVNPDRSAKRFEGKALYGDLSETWCHFPSRLRQFHATTEWPYIARRCYTQ
jgi:hypothetical protein